MAKPVIEYEPDAFHQLFNSDGMRSLLLELGNQVRTEAEATAQDAQKGPGGTISGYAEAGFEVVYEERGDRPRVKVVSRADGKTALKVLFYTQKRDGVDHLRRALYKFTKRGSR